MLIAEQGFDLIFKPLGDAAEAIADGFALLFALAALAAFVVMVIVIVVGAASAISLLVHGVVTGKRLVKQRYREKGPTIASPLLTLPGLVTPAVALVFMLKHGVQAEGGIPLALFLLSMAILLFVWFAPWAQHVRAISQDRNVSVGVALRQVVYQNRLRFLMTINLPVLLVSWVTAAISNWTGLPLLLFLLSVGVLLFVWFAWWAQEVRAIRQDRNVSISVALGQVIYRNKARFVMTIVVSLLLVSWLTTAKRESVAPELPQGFSREPEFDGPYPDKPQNYFSMADGDDHDSTSLAEFIKGKRIHFQELWLGESYWCAFSANGTTQHSARGVGTFKVDGLKVAVFDFEQVELSFPKANIAAGDTFEAKATGAEKDLLFEVLKVEPISGRDPTND